MNCKKGCEEMTVSESVIRWLKGFDADRLATVSTDMQTAEVKSGYLHENSKLFVNQIVKACDLCYDRREDKTEKGRYP